MINFNESETKIWLDGKLIYNSNENIAGNKAPDSISGEYDLSIKNNKIVLVDNKDGTTVEAKCHPEDGFDIGIGIQEAFKKLNEKRKKEEIQVNDYVEIIDDGKVYANAINFFVHNKLYYLGMRYKFGVIPPLNTKCKVVYVKDDKVIVQFDKEPILNSDKYIELDCVNGVYVVNKKGVKKL